MGKSLSNFRIVLAAAFLLLLPACLEFDETVTVYLLPGDKVDFVAYLDDIRSTSSKGSERLKEEITFGVDFRAGKIGKPELEKNGAKDVKAVLLRDHAPFVAVLTGKHDNLEGFWKNFDFNKGDAAKTAKLEKAGAKRKLVFRLPAPSKDAMPRPPQVRDDFPKHMKIILHTKPYTGAQGFLLDESKREAVLDEAAYLKLRGEGKPFELSLSW